MHSYIKKYFTFFLLISSFCIYAQTPNFFYKTYQDYKNNKPITDYSILSDSWEMSFGKESFKVVVNDKVITKDLVNLPSEFYVYNNTLFRIYKNHSYNVLVAGEFCFYSLYHLKQKQYYSNGITGKLKKYKSKVLKKQLVHFNLYENYKNQKPKREFNDDVNGYFNKLEARDITYFKLINLKVSEKID